MRRNNTVSFKSESCNFEDIKDDMDQKLNQKITLNDSIHFYCYENENRKRKLKNRYFICQYCHSSPKVSFINFNLLQINCDCKKIINLRPNDFIDHYTIHKNNNEQYFCCKEHNGYKYKYYCIDCKVNLCEDCLTKLKVHENHSLEYLLVIDDKIAEVKKLIKQIKKKLSKGDIEYRKILNLIEALIKKYKEYPCHNLYKTIFNSIEFLSHPQIPEITQMIKIRTVEELIDNKNDSHLISSIKINYQNFSDLSIFKELDLRNLKELQLQGNGIKSIEPFLNCNFENLKFFDIENNKLNDESFKHFDKIKFKKIEHMNLYENEIKSPEIFEKVINFKTLKIFYIGKNKFDKNEINKNINKKYYLTQLKEIGITGNFSDETTHFIPNLIFSDLEILYVSRNNLSSLKFLDKVNCPNLIEFWAINNSLTDYHDILKLPYKKTIKKINLKCNKISNINDLMTFISHFPSLKELILINNEINIDDPKNIEIIVDIRSKYKNLNLIIENIGFKAKN